MKKWIIRIISIALACYSAYSMIQGFQDGWLRVGVTQIFFTAAILFNIFIVIFSSISNKMNVVVKWILRIISISLACFFLRILIIDIQGGWWMGNVNVARAFSGDFYVWDICVPQIFLIVAVCFNVFVVVDSFINKKK